MPWLGGAPSFAERARVLEASRNRRVPEGSTGRAGALTWGSAPHSAGQAVSALAGQGSPVRWQWGRAAENLSLLLAELR